MLLLTVLPWVLSCYAYMEDEMQNYEPTCLEEDKFQCDSGTECIPTSQYCDGMFDCSDGSDETYCPHPKNCNDTLHFFCADNKACIINTFVCNNIKDCEDGSDEKNCSVVPIPENKNESCKGFLCDKNKCISRVWTCDGQYDCDDKTDESHETCRTKSHPLVNLLDSDCNMEIQMDGQYNKMYRCIDSSFCLPPEYMCNGMIDCRDGSDEGDFCKNWHTMCSSNPCQGNGTKCYPERYGYYCTCQYPQLEEYNYTTNACQKIDMCGVARPECSHQCVRRSSHGKGKNFECQCDEGYTIDAYSYLCHATGPEAMLFFSTKNEIGYIKLKTKTRVTVATSIKQAHGVAYDGKYLYWVETAHGHQAIMRAQLYNVAETKEVLVGLGLEDPGDIAVDWLGGHIYFSDAQRGIISVCRTDGSICATLPVVATSPKFVTLAVRYGKMYWADWHHKPVIMTAKMDGSNTELLLDTLATFATGLTVDVPNGRLYYVDHSIKVVKLDDKQTYSLFNEALYHPYAIAVFENTVYWSDLPSHSIQTTDKVHMNGETRQQLVTLDSAIFDMHVYHPLLMGKHSNPCINNSCSHLCLVTSNITSSCACPDGMKLNGTTCYHMGGFRPQYLIIGGKSEFTRIPYNSLGNPETHATHMNGMGWVQAMAYDSIRDTLYMYDGERKTISRINMTDFTLGITEIFMYAGIVDVVDMDYDYVSDSLYILDAGRRFIEVVSLRNLQRALLYRFDNEEIPLSLCVVPDYGKLLVAIHEGTEDINYIHVDSMGLDGSDRRHVVTNDLRGPRVRLRYAYHMNNVYLSDEGNSIIDYMNPEGTGHDNFRSLSTSIAGLAVTDTYVFWTDRRTPRLFWADVNDITHRIRRIEFSIFPNNTQLHIQATQPPPDPFSPLAHHPCTNNSTCSHVCVQTPHPHPHLKKQITQMNFGYKCLCPPSMILVGNTCMHLEICKEHELYCHHSNQCVKKGKRCDGIQDCKFGEDEENCAVNPEISTIKPIICKINEIVCNGGCIDKRLICTATTIPLNNSNAIQCELSQFRCSTVALCLERSQVCDGHVDCPDKSDEEDATCDAMACQEHEFMCTSRSCILSSFRCDGDLDCTDGSDEENCDNTTCTVGHYQCRNKQCIELRMRCDGHNDCVDHSDEEECEEPTPDEDETNTPHCADGEYVCALNASICLPATARCNSKVDCPGGTDEHGCDQRCASRGMFKCKQEYTCVPKQKICNKVDDCNDGSDETPEACRMVNRTSYLSPPPLFPADECKHGYLCENGQCLEWRQVCDNTTDCLDGTDENKQCSSACREGTHNCQFTCQPTPGGPLCTCPSGFKLQPDRKTCGDVDECAEELCSQSCTNMLGSFLCSCHHGYALRADRRTCKAVEGSFLAILYVSGYTVRSLYQDGSSQLEYDEINSTKIEYIDANIKKLKLYVAIPDARKLVEVSGLGTESVHNNTVVTNIGTPVKVAVEWVTGNVYIVDKGNNTNNTYIRVCNIEKRKCSLLQQNIGEAKVTALVIDPGSRRMFYCAMRDGESVVWSAPLSGQTRTDLATVGNCTGLVVDSFGKKLYVAETAPPKITRMDFLGEKQKVVLSDPIHLEAPQVLVLFEDWLYIRDLNTILLSRCRLYGPRNCQPFIYRMFDSTSFVINHPSIQRDDLTNVCDGVVCSNVCVLDETGPQCLCYDGNVAKDGNCEESIDQLPVINGVTPVRTSRGQRITFAAIAGFVFLFAMYLAIFIYYRCVSTRNRDNNYVEVRFQNVQSSSSSSDNAEPSSSIEMPTTAITPGASTGAAFEFVNPIQYVRDIIRTGSLRRTRRPIGTARLQINTPNLQQDVSDTESDQDERDDTLIVPAVN